MIDPFLIHWFHLEVLHLLLGLLLRGCCYKIREFFVYFIKIQAGVPLFTDMGQDGMEGIPPKGKNSCVQGRRIISCFVWIGDKPILTLDSNTDREGYIPFYYVQNLVVSRRSLQSGGIRRNAPRLLYKLFYITNI